MEDERERSSEQSRFFWWYHNSIIVRFLLSITPWFMATFPRWVPHVIRYLFALFYFIVGGRFRRAVEGNLRVALKDSASSWEIKKLTWRVFLNVTKSFVDLFYTASIPDERKNEIVERPIGWENVNRALDAGKGAIFVTGHIGNWEVGGIALAESKKKVHMVYIPDRFEAFERFRGKTRSTKNVESIPMGGTYEISLKLIRLLREGEIVAMKGDRVILGEGITIKFFGRDTEFPLGPSLISHISGAPIVPTFVVLNGEGKYQPIVCEPIFPEKSGNRKLDIERNVKKVAEVVEKFIREYPDQWYMFYPFWKGGS
ncbi:MAG: lysophospholipid acyltransferase family protein [Deltaproteobacteria bacterium]|uniref:Lysophospholipid acyltransferase family protein n=1 Tax=Candidatus Zymogenus saltonus TaxID=2844893 RepID=A0A9D8KJ75_9DELT|nr:lysophospholipid acyltransferase family protein [Candidatus Zymogenus saltonus]